MNWQPKRVLLCWLLVLGSTPTVAMAAELHVSPQGDDAAAGTSEQPLRTLQGAVTAVRASKQRGKEPLQIVLHAGMYYLPETIVLGPEDSGTERAPIRYQAANDGEVVISGGQKVTLDWQPRVVDGKPSGTLQARVPVGFSSDQLFINGQRQHMARYPNYRPDGGHFNGTAADAFSKERAARWSDPTGGFMHAMHPAHWGDMHYRITGRKPDGTLMFEGGWQNNRQSGMHQQHRFVENILEELDAPGEWFHDAKAGLLFVWPPLVKDAAGDAKAVDLQTATVEVVRLRHLIELRGTENSPVQHVTFSGLTFRHAARTFMENKEPLLRSDWTTYRGGALLLTGCVNCAIEDCLLDQLGGNAIFLSNFNRGVGVRRCHIVQAGANGVAFVGDPQAVRNPLFEYGQRQALKDLDRTPGPRTNNYPRNCVVDDCLIHETGRFEKQTAPVQISMAAEIRVSHCSIYDVPRAGINISEGTWGGHVIEHCDVFDTVKETGDHGSFNSWGRDRYWGLTDVDLNKVTLGDLRDLPKWDAITPTVLNHNRWRCDHGWDIDLDDGSTNYIITNNLCLAGGLKLREGFYRRVENNIIVNNSFHPHVWYEHSRDIFRRNVVFAAYFPIRVPKPWGDVCDDNLRHIPGLTTARPAADLRQQSGLDEHSLEADAQFVDSAHGDYRVREESPALKLGFQNFSMNDFGVVNAKLRAIAKTPVLPSDKPIANTASSRRPGNVADWLGARVKNVVGLGDVSAAGLPTEAGVVLVDVPKESVAGQAQLRRGDVILKVNHRATDTVLELRHQYDAASALKPLELTIWRDQKESLVTLSAKRPLRFSPGQAKFVGEGNQPTFDEEKDYLGSWVNERIELRWQRDLPVGATYDVVACIASTPDCAGAKFEVKIQDTTLTSETPNTRGWEQFTAVKLGQVTIKPASQEGAKPAPFAKVQITLTPKSKTGGAVMNLRSIELMRTDLP